MCSLNNLIYFFTDLTNASCTGRIHYTLVEVAPTATLSALVDMLVRINATLAAAGRLLGSFDQQAMASSLTAAGVCDVKFGRSPESIWL
eukprot:CAMPEP_0198689338 /NCGR_PEP_ID=MMETSP1468-20131203/137929_1 /TAXON_ID=1461545 /ORGANISM="Mantoniella sp, Strain CCMP1436" /LENGTH=88 /DNA_ID=CAMNT_0044440249 /DNA_START=23 /DNA_END=285 /DNA_ORIENTATION=-